MNLKVIVAILLIAVAPLYAQAQSRMGKVSKGATTDSVPNWDVTSSCRAAGQAAYTATPGEREKSCIEDEKRTREKLAADWSKFPAEERTRCIKSVEWFSPTYTELVACLEMYGDVRRTRENETAPNKPSR